MTEKRGICIAEKVRATALCAAGERSETEMAATLGVPRGTLHEWVVRYESEGTAGLVSTSENRVYSADLKRAAVEAYLSGKGSQREICKIFKIRSAKQLRNWLKVYNSGKDFQNKMSGGSRMKSTRKTTQEERVQIAKECIESENNYGLIAKKYGVSYQQARKWTLKYKELGERGLEDRRGQRTAQQQPRTEEEKLRVRVAQLERRLYLSEMENIVLKKLQEIERRDALGK